MFLKIAENDLKIAGDNIQQKLKSFSPVKASTNNVTISHNRKLINDEKINISDDKSIRRVVINRNDSGRYYNTNKALQRIADHNSSVQYNCKSFIVIL